MREYMTRSRVNMSDIQLCGAHCLLFLWATAGKFHDGVPAKGHQGSDTTDKLATSDRRANDILWVVQIFSSDVNEIKEIYIEYI